MPVLRNISLHEIPPGEIVREAKRSVPRPNPDVLPPSRAVMIAFHYKKEHYYAGKQPVLARCFPLESKGLDVVKLCHTWGMESCVFLRPHSRKTFKPVNISMAASTATARASLVTSLLQKADKAPLQSPAFLTVVRRWARPLYDTVDALTECFAWTSLGFRLDAYYRMVEPIWQYFIRGTNTPTDVIPVQFEFLYYLVDLLILSGLVVFVYRTVAAVTASDVSGMFYSAVDFAIDGPFFHLDDFAMARLSRALGYFWLLLLLPVVRNYWRIVSWTRFVVRRVRFFFWQQQRRRRRLRWN
ncbi:hypothetical protein FISHEDRAFT_70696 [Fistulina hepatica ATCC 64428]|uniref:Uncharacterized protein n=1 Tax=Fistulina hepatica ATCC 64428 TaxID=1128425 RepID=A0A0D7AKZ8_9AGAR|nr:hypothetical protein FISHEDRAFT_70696 [Fistulina hepatica ATCC 64428]